MTILARIRQWLCRHACYLDDIRRINPELVKCRCHRCGKMLSASYGLALNARLTQRPR